MKNNIIIVIIWTLFSLLVSGCSRNEGKNLSEKSDMFYQQSLDLGRKYTDSLKVAKDTASVNGLLERYAERMEQLSYDFPADLDLELSEWQNEQLIKVSANLVRVANARFKKVKDSQSTDSINTLD